jgi:translation initiation factor 2 gamma subunit (eIF-2gamma)
MGELLSECCDVEDVEWIALGIAERVVGLAFMTMAELQTVTARCPHCRGKMQLVRHISLADMPDLYVFLLRAVPAR